jgi:TolB-like protein
VKNHSYVTLSCAILVLCISCQPPGGKRVVQEPTMKSVFYLPAEVVEVQQNLVTLRVEKPPLFEAEVKLALQLAQEVIEKTYLLEGQKTSVNQSRVEVVRIIGSDILLKIIDKSHSFKPGDRVQISLAKKIIAIKDFEVIMGRNEEVAKYVQEDVTTALVNSGQFNVVERSKLQSVLDELAMAQTGLINAAGAKQIGKLLGADIVLTGTLAATGDEWNVNLRLINTETGLIAAALNKQGRLQELRPEAFREMKNIDGSFEDKTSDLAGWIVGEFKRGRTGVGGYQRIYIDDTQGAGGTEKSLAMDFKLGTERVEKFKNRAIHASITNRLKRDLTNYSGIRFSMKADRDLTVWFQVSDSQEGSMGEENWFRNISVTKHWKETRIPFNALSINKKRAQGQGTNQILQLNYVEKIDWLIHERSFGRGKEATIWLDEVAFY